MTVPGSTSIIGIADNFMPYYSCEHLKISFMLIIMSTVWHLLTCLYILLLNVSIKVKYYYNKFIFKNIPTTVNLISIIFQ